MVELVIAGAAYSAVIAWLLGDWEVRTVRSAALLVIGTIAGGVIAIALDGPIGLAAGLAIACAFAVPVVIHHPVVLALQPADSQMMHALRRVEDELILASDALRRRRIDVAEYHRRLTAAQVSITNLQPPDDEWARVLHLMSREIGVSAGAVYGHRDERLRDEISRRRNLVRNESRELLQRRRSWH